MFSYEQAFKMLKNDIYHCNWQSCSRDISLQNGYSEKKSENIKSIKSGEQ